MQRFLSFIAFSVYEDVRVACQSRSIKQTNYATDITSLFYYGFNVLYFMDVKTRFFNIQVLNSKFNKHP